MAVLRAVDPGETPGRPLSIMEAVARGDRLAELVATHKRIARAVEDEATPPRDLASLTRRQLEISKEIEALRRQQGEEGAESVVVPDEGWSAEAI